MQFTFWSDDTSRVVKITRRLRAYYGTQPPAWRFDPVTQLVFALLGARTRGVVQRKAFEALYRRFGNWAALREASPDDVEPFIRPVTFAEKKAEWLPADLKEITRRRGRLDLDFLGDLPVDAAQQWLEQLPGVGPKVSAAVLNFSTLQMRALVVDTHHYRVAQRIGLISSRTGFPNAHRVLSAQLPEHWTAAKLDDHHRLMKLHGQVHCKFERPICRSCPIWTFCDRTRWQ
jgi:endonuclease-3